MKGRKGFTLAEIVVVMVIIGILVAAAIPNFMNSMFLTKVQQAENNLRGIAAGQQKYYEDYGKYYATPPSGLPNDMGAINSLFRLNMSAANEGFNYSCVTSGTQGTSNYAFSCSAINPDNPTAAGTMVTVDSKGNMTCTGAVCP